MGRGGARFGAGRKRKTAVENWLSGDAGKRGRPIEAPAETPGAPVAMPADLPADQAAIWSDLAPHATTAGTLTVETARAFRDLCRITAVRDTMLAAIEHDGFTQDKVSLQMDESGGGLQSVEKKAHPLLGKWLSILPRVEQGMARFGITGTGKAKTTAAPTKTLSPLEALKAKSQLRRIK
jgi:hypothetical protein